MSKNFAAEATSPDARIAIVGMGACLPDAPDVATFWRNVCNGHVAIGEVPADRWSQGVYFDGDRSRMDRTYSRIGGFIRYNPFDSKRFRLVPRSLPAIDDLQKFALVAVAEALTQAGMKVFAKDEAGAAFDRERCATIFGNTMGGEFEDRTSLRVWLLEVEDALITSAQAAGRSPEEARRIASELHAHYAPMLPRLTEDSMPGELSNCITGRVANIFDLCGANFTTDAACASTMAAVQAGVRGLLDHEFDTALVGGADRSMDPPAFVKFCRIGALSPDRSTPFDAGANGFVMGEGVGVLVLKRYEDAVASGQQVLAVIRGIGASSDGRGKGMTAPNPRGQRLAVQRAWAASGLELQHVGLLEAHGTSTAVGDACEAQVLTELLEEAGHAGAPVPLGSVKSMIGHLKSASGAASLIKATLALQHKTLPPSAGFTRAAEGSPLHRGRLAVQTTTAPWPRGTAPRSVGVSSFGFGGTNFHVVLEEAPDATAPATAARLPEDADMHSRPSAAPLAAAATAPAVAAASTGPQPQSKEALTAAITAVFAEHTGYSVEDLEPAHHLEADLGIDSVKQAEIMAVLRQQYAVAESAELKLAELSTLAAIVGFVQANRGDAAPPAQRSAPPDVAAAASPAPAAATSPASPAAAATTPSSPPPTAPPAAAAPAVATAILPEVYAFGAATFAEAIAAGRDLLAAEDMAALHAARGRAHEAPARIAFVAAGHAEARARLQDVEAKAGKAHRLLAAKGIFVAEGAKLADTGDIAFLFPGQGSQYLGMLEDLAARYPVVADTFAEADRILAPLIGKKLTAIVWPAARDEAHELALRQTEVCQPAMLTADVALARLLAQFGVGPKVVVGHSLGEYAATVVAGVLSFADALYAVSARGREMAGVKVDDPGRMAMVAADAGKVEAVLAGIDGYVIAANKNCHTQTVIAGDSQAVAAALAAFAAGGIEARGIAVSHAFHSAIVAPAAEPLRRVLEGLQVNAPKVPLSSNVDAKLYPQDAAGIVDRLARQLASPVQFIDQVEALWHSGARLFVEVGPRRAITGFVRNILGTREHRAFACNHPKKPGPQGVLETLAALTAEGVAVRYAGDELADASPALTAPRSFAASATPRPAQPSTPAANPSAQAKAAPRNAPQPYAVGRAPLPAGEAVVISGTSVLLPGQEQLHAWDQDPYAQLLRGTNFIAKVKPEVQQSIVDKQVVRLEKASGSFVPLTHRGDVLQHVASMGPLDLSAWGVDAGHIEAMDVTARLTVAAGLEALRDAGLPLVAHMRTTSTGSKLHDRWGLPRAIAERTGVILGSAFPSLDAVLREVRERDEAHASAGEAEAPPAFDRKWLFRALPMGHAQLAQVILAQGPNTQVNAACASGTQALAMAADWIRLGRCDRVVVVTADDVTQKDALQWVGAGFLAAGAASNAHDLSRAAVPFGAERNGLILGSGAAAFVVERESASRARGIEPVAELVAGDFVNSAFHGTRLDPPSISRFLRGIVDALDADEAPAARRALAAQTVFLSHETYTPARGGSAAAEVDSLRHLFGEGAQELVIANTKGFTGHPMGASFEDLVAIKGLQRQQMPPIANFHRPDPAFADLRFADGAAIDARYAIRFAAGFGSQVAACAYRRVAEQEGRMTDRPAFAAWCADVGIDCAQGFEVHKRVLRAAPQQGVPLWELGVPSLLPPAPLAEAASAPRPSAAPAALKAQTAAPAVTTAPMLAQLTQIFAEETGYSAEDLQPAHALEADLGIDSVKQAEILALVRGRYGIAADVQLNLAQVSTLADIAAWLQDNLPAQAAAASEASAPESKLTSAASPGTSTAVADPAPAAVSPTPAPSPAAASASSSTAPASPSPAAAGAEGGQSKAELLAELTALFAEQTGYDAADLAPDHALEADLGIDSVKQAEILAMVRARYGMDAEVPMRLADVPTLEALAGLVHGALAQAGPSAPQPSAALDPGSQAVATQSAPSADADPAPANVSVASASVPSAVSVAPASAPAAVAAPSADLAAVASAPAGATAPASPGDILAELTSLFARETGYDESDLAPDHALEADLGIDSVKQAELFAQVRSHYRLGTDPEFRLAEVQTLSAMAAYVAARQPGEQDASAGAKPAASASATEPCAKAHAPHEASIAPGTQARVAQGGVLARRVMLLPVPAPAPAEAPAIRGAVEVFGLDAAAVAQVTRQLRARGVDARAVDTAALAKAADAQLQQVAAAVCVISPGIVDAAFLRARAWAQQDMRPGRLLAIGCEGRGFGLLPPGPRPADPAQVLALAQTSALLKSLDKEWTHSRCVTLDVVDAGAHGVHADPWSLATDAAVLALAAPRAQWGYLEALVHADVRAPEALAQARWYSPARSPEAVLASAAPLATGARVVATGGARGITYALLLALAERRPLDLVILGRTPGVKAEDSVLYRRTDDEVRAVAKAALVAAGERATPMSVRAWVERERVKVEIAANMAALEALGCTVQLLACDVSNPAALAAAMAQIMASGSRPDLLLHGAGYEESRRIEDKDARALQRTAAPKSAALQAMLRALEPRRTVTMGSIAGRFGNAAQSDYAVANEALSAHARLHPASTLNIGWTAWADIGMAERGSVRRVLEANGVVMLPRAVGTQLGALLIESSTTGDVVVAGPLGAMGEGERLVPSFFAGAALQWQAPAANQPHPPGRILLQRVFSPQADVGLDHHRIGNVAVLPGVLGIEMMVQAASWLHGAPVRYLRDIKFAAPIKFFHDRPQQVSLEATAEPGGYSFEVCTTFTGPDGNTKRRVHFSGRSLSRAPAAPTASPAALAAFGPVRQLPPLQRPDIYRRYFHGPRFQVLADAPRLGDGGVDAVAMPNGADWLADFPKANLMSQPWLREAGFQAAGLHEMAQDGRMALPAGIDELWLAAPAAASAPAPAHAVVARCRGNSSGAAVFDILARDAAGGIDTMRGYRTIELRGLGEAERMVPVGEAPRVDRQQVSLAEVQALLLPEQAAALTFYLSSAERQRLAQLNVKKRRIDWLAGRLAAKALLRRTWQPAHLRPAWSAMTIAADGEGEPEVLLDAEAAQARRAHAGVGPLSHPRISISHSGDVALAVVSWNGEQMVGIDVERVQQRDPSFAATYFTAAEQAFAGAEAALQARALTVLWSIKEATLKALGLASQVDMRQLEVSASAPLSATQSAALPQFSLRLHGEAARKAGARQLSVVAIEVELAGEQIIAQVTVRRASRPGRTERPSPDAAAADTATI